MSNPKSSFATALLAMIAGFLAFGGAILLFNGDEAFKRRSVTGKSASSLTGTQGLTPESSRDVEALMTRLLAAQRELDHAIQSRSPGVESGGPVETDASGQLVRELIAQCDTILSRDDVSSKDRRQARRTKQNTLCKAAVHLRGRFAGEADAYCQQIVDEVPGTDEAADALGYLIAKKYLVEGHEIDADARRELTQYAREYPHSNMAVALFLKVSQRLARSRRADAIRLTKLGITICANHSNASLLREQLAQLEGRSNRNRPRPTHVSRSVGGRSPHGSAEYPTEPSRLLGMQMGIRGPLLRGGYANLGAYRGKVLLVDFWATWCGPCRREMPTIRRLYSKYQRGGLAVVGISLDTDRNELKEFVLSNDLNWPQIFVPSSGDSGWENPIARTYDVESIPMTFLVSRRGKIVAVGLRGNDLEDAIRNELAM